MSSALQRKANHINNNIRVQLTHPLTKKSGLVFGFAVCDDLLNRLPGGMGLIRGALASTNVDNVMSGLDQAGNQVSAHVTSTTDNYNTHCYPPFIAV
jgi:hypothetical protein